MEAYRTSRMVEAAHGDGDTPVWGALKSRDLTSRDHQNFGDWHHETWQN